MKYCLGGYTKENKGLPAWKYYNEYFIWIPLKSTTKEDAREEAKLHTFYSSTLLYSENGKEDMEILK